MEAYNALLALFLGVAAVLPLEWQRRKLERRKRLLTKLRRVLGG